MRTFTLAALEGTLTLQSEEPRSSRPYDPWEYVAELATGSVSARVEVHDHMPNGFREFFSGLAQDWKGWAGERHYQSLEPMLKLSVKHDGKGFALFTLLLRAGASESFSWSVSQRLTVELGQLSKVAQAAANFADVEARVVV
jgi:hypothetical protein